MQNQSSTSVDSVLQDSQFSGFIFFVAFIFLILFFFLDLTTLDIFPNVKMNYLSQVWLALPALGILFSIIFFSVRSTWKEKGWFILSWLFFTSSLFFLNIDKIGGSGLPHGSKIGSIVLSSLCFSCSIFLLLRISNFVHHQQSNLYNHRLGWLFFLILLLVLVPAPILQITSSLHPQTFDLFAFKFDALVSVSFVPLLYKIIQSIPGGVIGLNIIYISGPIWLLLIALKQLNGKPYYVPSALLVWLGMTSLAWLAFHFYPISGPAYTFGEDFFKYYAQIHVFPTEMVSVLPYPRNAMPSMHFGWMLAACILWWQSGMPKWSYPFIVLATMLMWSATLYKGEHYLIDLIVAVPFVLSSLALFTRGIPFNYFARKYNIVLGFSTWLIWIFILRTQIELFIAHPWLVKGLIGITAIVVICQAYLMSLFKQAPAVSYKKISLSILHPHFAIFRRFWLLFFFSGVAALIYQVLFAKELALIFGSTAVATLTVLATFLGGMAVGSLVGGILAHRSQRPLEAYAMLEGGIAFYCMLTPFLFYGIQGLYVMSASGLPPESTALLFARVLLGGLVLLLPTILMGASLPLITSALGDEKEAVGSRVAWLYFANTAGASLGALLAAYWIIPFLGVKSTTLVAAGINLIVAFAAFKMSEGLPLNKKLVPSKHKQRTSCDSNLAIRTQLSLRWLTSERLPLVIAALLSLGIGGVLSLGLEVVYVHMLSIVAGNSVYAFGLMLATFLLGLALGGEAGRQLILRAVPNGWLSLAGVLLGLSVCLGLTLSFWNDIPLYFGGYANYPLATSFVSREAIRGIVCCLVMLPPTLFIGTSYTLAIDLLTKNSLGAPFLSLGIGAMVNTIGNVIGVILFGFFILPRCGGLDSIRLIAYVVFILAIVVWFLTIKAQFKRGIILFGIGLLVLFLTHSTKLNYEWITSGANVYFYPQNWGLVLDHAESIDGGLTSVNAQPDQLTLGGSVAGVVLGETLHLMSSSAENTEIPRRAALSQPGIMHTLLTNGKFQGNDAIQGEVRAQVGIALAPLLHTDKRGKVLVIGYGTGTSGRVIYDAGFEHMDIAELSADVMHLADKYFNILNHDVSHAPNTTLHITDGRNLLLLSKEKYDLISMEISSIWFAGAASLYNREFYQLVKARLSDEGVLQQWVQLHHLSPLDILVVISTIHSEFRYVSLYIMGDQGILVATNSEIHKSANPKAISALELSTKLTEVRQMLGDEYSHLVNYLLLTPEDTDKLLAHYFGSYPLISTDNNLFLEYSTPKGNVNNSFISYQTNLWVLKAFSSTETKAKVVTEPKG